MSLPDVVMPPSPPPSPSPSPSRLAEPEDDPPPPPPSGASCSATPVEPPMKVKPVLEDEAVFKDVKPRKKSQKQLDHLAKAREKALAVRQAKAQEKKRVKFSEQATHDDPRPKENKESVILHMSVAEFQKMSEQSNLKAVEDYDAKRKAQKKVKRDAQEEYAKANKVNQTINRALGVPDPDDIWASCFE